MKKIVLVLVILIASFSSYSQDTLLDSYVVKTNIIFPNPTSNLIYIYLDFPYTEIYNNLGDFILGSDKTNINIDFLPNGIYNIIVLSGNKKYHKQIRLW